MNFPNLVSINFTRNKISCLDVLSDVEFNDLKELKLNFNYISDIKIFQKVSFKKLETVNLESNKIILRESLKDIEYLNSKVKNVLLNSN